MKLTSEVLKKFTGKKNEEKEDWAQGMLCAKEDR